MGAMEIISKRDGRSAAEPPSMRGTQVAMVEGDWVFDGWGGKAKVMAMERMSLESEILTAEDIAQGFGLWEEEGFVYLTRHGETVATFSASAATKEAIREEIARQYLAGGV